MEGLTPGALTVSLQPALHVHCERRPWAGGAEAHGMNRHPGGHGGWGSLLPHLPSQTALRDGPPTLSAT